MIGALAYHPKRTLAENFEGTSRDWNSGEASIETSMLYTPESRFGIVAEFTDGIRYINYPDFEFKGTFSANFWCKLRSSPYSYFAGTQVSANRGGRLLYTTGFSIISDSGSIITLLINLVPFLNKWAYYTFELDVENLTMSVFVNSELIATQNITGTFNDFIQNFKIGVRPDRPDRLNLNGYMKNLQIFNCVLPQSDIIRIMNGLNPISI